MNFRQIITTLLEVAGAICIVSGIAFFSVPVSVIVAGVLMVVAGGLAA